MARCGALVPQLTERDVARQVRDFMEAHGWRCIRMQVASVARPTGGGFRVGEVGMPDFLFIRYNEQGFDAASRITCCEHLWVEVKRPGGRVSEHQREWVGREMDRGGVVVVVDDIDEFRTWYADEVGH